VSKILIKSAWGSDDPTKAAFAFIHGSALAEAGHEVQIFLLGEATPLMRTALLESVYPVGWPPLAETFARVKNLNVRIHV
jgi:predicted peroxiredoxin